MLSLFVLMCTHGTCPYGGDLGTMSPVATFSLCPYGSSARAVEGRFMLLRSALVDLKYLSCLFCGIFYVTLFFRLYGTWFVARESSSDL